MTDLDRALKFAERKHRGQVYGSNRPYIWHIINTVAVAIDLNFDDDIKIACALHDTLEDTETTKEEIISQFGNDVYELVYLVTNKPGKNRKEKHLKTYPPIKKNWKATAVKLCDRISNIKASYNTPFIKMYLKENDLFTKLLYSHDKRLLRAWDLLTESLNNIP